MKKLLLCLLSLGLLLGLVPLTRAQVLGSVWYENWENYRIYDPNLGGPENATSATVLYSLPSEPGYKIRASLEASVYQYQPYFYRDAVFFRLALYFKSTSPDGSGFPVSSYVSSVQFYVEKDIEGSDLNKQTIYFVSDDPTPGFCQGNNLTKSVPVSSDFIERAGWGLKVISAAVAFIELSPLGIASTLVACSSSYSPQGGMDHQNAGLGDSCAWSAWWNNGGIPPREDPWDPIRQDCVDTIIWHQERTDPATYYGLKISAAIWLSNDAYYLYGTEYFVTMPVRLRIYNSGGGTPPGGDGCPTLFSWSGTSYVDHGVIDIHNPSGEDVVREVPVSPRDLAVESHGANFKLREGWPELNFSESVIDRVNLYAIGELGNCYPCPLISATHSQLGDVLRELRRSDDRRVQLLLLETLDLTFYVPFENAQAYFFRIEGCNRLKQ